MSDGGKGSSPRPYSVDQSTFANNWDQIFGKKKPNDQKENALNELVRLSQELGLYDDSPSANTN